MGEVWSTVNDDELRLIQQAVDFLQSKFCPEGAEPMWSAEYFRWKLGESNPAGKGYISLAMIGGKVVGVFSLAKKRILIDGVECVGGEIGDGYSSVAIMRSTKPASLSSTDQNPDSYINKSVFGRLVSDVTSRAEADGLIFIYGTPNENSYLPLVNRLNYFELTGYFNSTFSRPTAMLVISKYPALKSLAPVLRAFDFSYQSVNSFFCGSRASKGWEFEVGLPATQEIEALWVRVKPMRGFSLVRDEAYWRHRYCEHPFARHTFFSIREKGKLVGIVVIRVALVRKRKSVAYIVEWMLENQVKFGSVLSYVMAHYRRTDVQSFSLWAQRGSREAKAAAKALFLFRGRAPIVFADHPTARSLQNTASETKFFFGSSDAV